MAMKIKGTEAIVLAGGRGARMGGRDKGLVELCEKPLVQWVIDSIAPQVEGVVLSANRNNERYKSFGFPVVADQLEDFQGPLAGIHAALQEVTRDFVLVVPADSPNLPVDLCQKLYSALMESNAEIAVVETGGQIQPVLLFFRRELKLDIGQWLEGGSRKVRDWIESRRFVTVPFPADELISVNINDPESLVEATEKLCG